MRVGQQLAPADADEQPEELARLTVRIGRVGGLRQRHVREGRASRHRPGAGDLRKQRCRRRLTQQGAQQQIFLHPRLIDLVEGWLRGRVRDPAAARRAARPSGIRHPARVPPERASNSKPMAERCQAYEPARRFPPRRRSPAAVPFPSPSVPTRPYCYGRLACLKRPFPGPYSLELYQTAKGNQEGRAPPWRFLTAT